MPSNDHLLSKGEQTDSYYHYYVANYIAVGETGHAAWFGHNPDEKRANIFLGRYLSNDAVLISGVSGKWMEIPVYDPRFNPSATRSGKIKCSHWDIENGGSPASSSNNGTLFVVEEEGLFRSKELGIPVTYPDDSFPNSLVSYRSADGFDISGHWTSRETGASYFIKEDVKDGLIGWLAISEDKKTYNVAMGHRHSSGPIEEQGKYIYLDYIDVRNSGGFTSYKWGALKVERLIDSSGKLSTLRVDGLDDHGELTGSYATKHLRKTI